MKKPFHPIGEVNNTACITITVREYGGTYIARCNGKSASCTSSAKHAARAAAKKAAQIHIDLGIIAEPKTELHVTDIGGGMFTCNLGPMLPRRTQL